MMATLTQCGNGVAQMSVYEGFTHLAGGKICHGGGLEETASQLLWCEHCGVALCFDCDSHCHHAKNARSTHLRVLLPSSRTSSVPRCEHGSNPTGGDDYHHLVPQAWRRASVRGGLSANSLDDLISGQSTSSSKDKRKRNRKKEKSSTSTSSLSQKESLKGYDSLAKSESKPVPSCEFVTEQQKVVCDDGGVAACEDVGNFVLESDTSDISLSSSPELGSPILLRAVSSSAVAKPQRSALRGGSEQVGLGPRPKLHVKWHPDVFDPICSTVSHTVGHNKTGPTFISKRSYQKHLRQKSKGSSKSQGRGKNSSHKSKKNSEPSKSRSHDSYDSLAKNGLQEDLSGFSNAFTDGKLVGSELDCTKTSKESKSYDEGVQSDDLREANDISDEELEAILYELHQAKSGDVQLERPANTSVQEKPPISTRAELAIGDKERKISASNNVEDKDDFMDVGFPESYLKALACMLHVAKTASTNDSMSKAAEYKTATGVFRDTERHARAVNISAPEEVVKQAARGQSTWISVI